MFPEGSPGPERQTMLSVMLSIVALGGFLLFLILVSGGFFLWVLAGVFAIFFVGLLHYLAWGASLHQRTEGDREEDRVRQEMEDNRW
jgi:hypothetical protein